jgi:hypothetical protein
LGSRFAFLEKRVTALASASSREQSELVLARHELKDGSSGFVVEDVCNNFSTTDQAAAVLAANGVKLVSITCFLNRSSKAEWEGRPVIALVDRPSQQWRQDDPAVAADIQVGNVVWKPKLEWPRLMKAVAEAKSAE